MKLSYFQYSMITKPLNAGRTLTGTQIRLPEVGGRATERDRPVAQFDARGFRSRTFYDNIGRVKKTVTDRGRTV